MSTKSTPPSTPKPPSGPSTPKPPSGPKHGALAGTTEVAEYLGVPVKTLYQWRWLHKGPRGAKVGKHLKYRWADVEQWFDQQAAA